MYEKIAFSLTMSVPLYNRLNSEPVLESWQCKVTAQVVHISSPSIVVSRNPLNKLRRVR